jgi:competence protein ComEA
MGRTLNVNEANRPTLCLLPGIGPRLAERIITTRRRIGPIGDLQQLQQVRGIGPGIARDIAPHVRFERLTSPRTHARNDSPGQLNISLPTDDP